MKSFYTLIFSLCALLMLSTQVSANKVVVKGYVKFSNGAVAVKWPVIVATDSSNTALSCNQSHTVYTNENGFYVDTLICSYNIVKVRIYTKDCNNAYVVHDPQVSPNNVVESNFIICAPAVVRCEAAFEFKRADNSLIVQFSSGNSHSTGSTDKIVRRRWKFSDGDTIGGNVVDPAHTFKQRGIYQACLTIWTAAGCENTVCKTISITDSIPKPPVPPTVHCVSKFVFEVLPATSAAGVSVRFNSKPSSTATGDSIRERIWKFGDGTTANTIDPLHTYPTGGAFNVCLIIRSANGCSDTSCITIQLPKFDTVKCHADFSAVASGKVAKFNSVNSQSSPGDILSRRWDFGDNQILEGNIKDPAHEYKEAGTYTVCLTIKTSRGCESKECKKIVITVPVTTPPPTTVKCQSAFSYEILSAHKIRFNSTKSIAVAADSIVERRWEFGDGITLQSRNEINPAKEFPRPGVYTVCLLIKTKKGCESKYCTTVRIGDSISVPPVNSEYIKIVSLRPNPVVTPLNTDVWSHFNNIKAELSIYDIYGVKKWSISKVLLQGNNITSIPTGFLLPGPYFFRVTTMYGVKSAGFFKL